MMKKVLSLLSLLVLMPSGSMLLAGGCSSTLIDQAEAARKEAAALRNEWRDTASLIASAKEACEQGQQAKADELASRALNESQQAVAQAQFMEKNWEMMIPEH